MTVSSNQGPQCGDKDGDAHENCTAKPDSHEKFRHTCHIEIALDDGASPVGFKVPVEFRSETIVVVPPLPQAELVAVNPPDYRFGALET